GRKPPAPGSHALRGNPAADALRRVNEVPQTTSAADGAAATQSVAEVRSHALRGNEGKGRPLLERWKVLDNLRRSLAPPALVLWLARGWTLLAVPWWLTTGLALLVLLLPLLLHLQGVVIHTAAGRSLLPVRELRDTLPPTLGQLGLTLVFLLNQAYL